MQVTIQTVARLTGLSSDTIRIWERRYQAVTPTRDQRGIRLYTEQDIRRLKLLGEAVSRGERISKIVTYPDERLRRFVEPAKAALENVAPAEARATANDGPRARQAEVAALSRNAAAGDLLHALYAQAVLSVAKGLQAEYASIYEAGPREECFILRAHHGWPKLPDDNRLPLDPNTLPGYAYILNEPVIMSDRNLERRFEMVEPLRDQPIRSAIAIPFGVHNRCGVLVAHSTRPGVFAAEDAAFVESIGQVLTVAAERAQSYEDSQRARSALHDILQTIEDPLVVVDARGHIREVNDSFSIGSGTGRTVIGRSAWETLPHLHKPQLRRRFQEILADGQPARYEFFSDLTKRWVETRMHPISEGFAVYFHDITLQKYREFALERGGGLFRKLFRQIPGALWTTDSQLVLLTLTGKLVDRLRAPKRRIVGRNLAELLDHPDAAQILNAHTRALAGDSAVADGKVAAQQVRVFVEPIRDAVQAPVGTVAFAIATN